MQLTISRFSTPCKFTRTTVFILKRFNSTVQHETRTTSVVPRWESTGQRLHHEIIAYLRRHATPREVINNRHRFLWQIRESLQRRIKGSVEVKPYGSVSTGLDIGEQADIDISITGDGLPKEHGNKKTNHKRKVGALRKILGMLIQDGLIVSKELRQSATVPVLVGTTPEKFGSMSFDITVNQTDGTLCTGIIKNYLASMPALFPLVLILKMFLREHRLNNAAEQGLSSYSLTCMCINFLQINPGHRLPHLLTEPEANESLGVLLLDFLIYYGAEFPYNDMFISVAKGKILPKYTVEWVEKKEDRIAIECLVQPRNDVGRPTRNIPQLKVAFKGAAASILNADVRDPLCLGMILKIEDPSDFEKQAYQGWENKVRIPAPNPFRFASTEFPPQRTKLGASTTSPPAEGNERESSHQKKINRVPTRENKSLLFHKTSSSALDKSNKKSAKELKSKADAEALKALSEKMVKLRPPPPSDGRSQRFTSPRLDQQKQTKKSRAKSERAFSKKFIPHSPAREHSLHAK